MQVEQLISGGKTDLQKSQQNIRWIESLRYQWIEVSFLFDPEVML